MDPPDMGFYEVVQIGVRIVGVTNFANALVSNTITIPFEAANEVGSLLNVVVQIDGTRYRGVSPMIAPGISGNLTLDTSFLENGDHSVQVIAGWENPDVFDFNSYTLTRYSDPFTISVSNIIYFPDWDDEIGELGFAFYSFKTSCTNVDWQIDIYDVSNNLARTLTGHTVDGTVETNWDLIDVNGVTRATNDADAQFSSIITVYDAPVSKKTPPKRKPITYPSHGQWAIAYQDVLGNIARSNEFWNEIYDFGGMAAQYGGAVSVFPTPGHPEYGQAFPMRFNYTNDPTPPTGSQIIADEDSLVWLITNIVNRNFFYMGHVDGERMASINSDRISSLNPKGHYYRFVFLDGCSSATGSWPAAFGINFNSTQELDYFQKHGMRPRTFVGYTRIVNYAQQGSYIDPDTGQLCFGIIPDRVMYFLSNFEFYWNYYYNATWSIIYAENDTPDVQSGWADGPDLAIFGYNALYIDAYNHKADWSN